MEKLLNVVWLLLALAISAGWLGQRTRSRNRSLAGARLQAIALVCLVVFLFFPISISDDLQWTVLATEAEASWKMIKSLEAGGSATVPGLHVTAVFPIVALRLAARTASLVDRFVAIGSPAAGFCQDFSGRSPPFFG